MAELIIERIRSVLRRIRAGQLDSAGFGLTGGGGISDV